MNLTTDLSQVRWRKASRSSSTGSDCVELAHVSGLIAVRDSKAPNGPELVLPPDSWHHLTSQIIGGEFDIQQRP